VVETGSRKIDAHCLTPVVRSLRTRRVQRPAPQPPRRPPQWPRERRPVACLAFDRRLSMESNEERQREEITVLRSIYDHDFEECPPPKAWRVRAFSFLYSTRRRRGLISI
jgi:hypothetical protein